MGDTTYKDLPMPGEMDPGKLRPASTLSQRFGIESATQRGKFLGDNHEHLNASQNLKRFGRRDGFLGDRRPTINRTGKTLDSFEANATRTSAVVTLKSSSIHEDGFWVLKKPFNAPAKQNPDGTTTPATPMALYEPIDESMVDLVPLSRRVCINTETLVDWEQINFDILSRECDFDDVVHNLVHIKQIVGWSTCLYEWDQIANRHSFKFFPPQQWYLDPIKSNVSDMNRLRLDMIVDTEEAKRFWPQAEEAIDLAASKSVKYAPGQMGYSDLYVGGTLFSTPIVTMTLMWLRNFEVPMTLQEALGSGMVKESQDEPEAAPDEGGDGTEDAAGGEGDEQENTEADNSVSGEDAGGESGVAPTKKIMHAISGEDLTDSFDGEGNPAKELHPNHPLKLIILQWIEIDNKVVPGTYMQCPHWDINVVLDKNNEIMFRPFGDPETLALGSPQDTINSMHEAMVSHAQWFKGPAGFVTAEFEEGQPEGWENAFAKPQKIHVLKPMSDPNMKLSDHFLQLKPPEMSTALPQVLDRVNNDFEKIGDAGVNNGTPPTGVTAASAISNLQSLSHNTNDLKSRHTERAIRRCAKLMLHPQIHWLSVDAIMKFNRKYPREIVERYFMPMRKEILLDVEVSLPTGSGMVKQQKDAQVRSDFIAKMIDEATAQEQVGYDSEDIARNRKLERQQMAEEAAEQAAKASQGQKPGPNISISVGYQYLQPEAQSGVLQMMGLPPLTQSALTVDHQLTAAKIQNEANRTAVDAASKQHTMAMNEHGAQQNQQPEPVGA